MKITSHDSILMCFTLEAQLDEVNRFMMECLGLTPNAIQYNMEVLINEKKYLDNEYKITKLGEEKIRSLALESGREIRVILYDRMSVEEKILFYTYHNFQGTVDEIQKWIAQVDYLVPHSGFGWGWSEIF